MAIKKAHKPTAIVLSIFLVLIGLITGVVAFAQNFDNIKVNEALFFVGQALIGIGLALGAWFTISFAVDMIREAKKRES